MSLCVTNPPHEPPWVSLSPPYRARPTVVSAPNSTPPSSPTPNRPFGSGPARWLWSWTARGPWSSTRATHFGRRPERGTSEVETSGRSSERHRGCAPVLRGASELASTCVSVPLGVGRSRSTNMKSPHQPCAPLAVGAPVTDKSGPASPGQPASLRSTIEMSPAIARTPRSARRSKVDDQLSPA